MLMSRELSKRFFYGCVMKLTRKNVKKKLSKTGKSVTYYDLFLCPYCNKEVVRERKSYKQKSCGCADRKTFYESVRTHGESKTKLYQVWATMKKRCLNSKSHLYKYYGGRGITICNEWMEYTPFRDWSLAHGYKEGLTIDRVDNNGNYKPDNCRWITSAENGRNNRNAKITWSIAREIREKFIPRKYTCKMLANEYNIHHHHVWRIVNNWCWPCKKNGCGRFI